LKLKEVVRPAPCQTGANWKRGKSGGPDEHVNSKSEKRLYKGIRYFQERMSGGKQVTKWNFLHINFPIERISGDGRGKESGALRKEETSMHPKKLS